jgi:hypothetical protein
MPSVTRHKPSVLRWYHYAALICLALIIVSYCSPIRISFPIHGKVIDRETKQPIEGAAVRLNREAICRRMFHGSDRYRMRTLEATTDSEGYFRIGGIFGAAPCLAPHWLYTLAIVAVGYIPTFTDNEEDDRLAGPSVFGTYQINPIRFWLERLNLYEQFKTSPGSDNSAFDKAIETSKAAVTHDLTPPGVFATAKNANFNFVTVKSSLIPDPIRQGRSQQHTVIIARDSLGRFYGWDSSGKQIDLDRQHEPYNSNPESDRGKLGGAEVAANSAAKCETSAGFAVSRLTAWRKATSAGFSSTEFYFEITKRVNRNSSANQGNRNCNLRCEK